VTAIFFKPNKSICGRIASVPRYADGPAHFCLIVNYVKMVVVEWESALTTGTTMAAGRFSNLLHGDAEARKQHDQVLLSHSDWVVAPTLGAIIPDWLIVIPRMRALSFRSWRAEQSKEPEAIIGKVRDHLGLASEDIIWFEHGPATHGSLVGCGTDYAHLHILLKPNFPFETFLRQGISMSSLSWAKTELERAYASLPEETSYLLAGSGNQAAWASQVDATGSQFFRRVIASLSKRPEGWDYRSHAHADNISRTIETFRELERDVQRGG